MNDIGHHHDMDMLWRDMTIFSDLVRLHGYDHQLGEGNTFTMATLPYAPKYCWLSDDLEAPSGFRCHYDVMRQFNDRLLQRNYAKGLPLLDLSSMGMKFIGNAAPPVNGFQMQVSERPLTDYGQWREAVPWRMLHLNDRNRILMSMRVSSYFTALMK